MCIFVGFYFIQILHKCINSRNLIIRFDNDFDISRLDICSFMKNLQKYVMNIM